MRYTDMRINAPANAPDSVVCVCDCLMNNLSGIVLDVAYIIVIWITSWKRVFFGFVLRGATIGTHYAPRRMRVQADFLVFRESSFVVLCGTADTVNSDVPL